MILEKELRASKAPDLVNRDIKLKDLVTKNQALDQMILQPGKQPATPAGIPEAQAVQGTDLLTSHGFGHPPIRTIQQPENRVHDGQLQELQTDQTVLDHNQHVTAHTQDLRPH